MCQGDIQTPERKTGDSFGKTKENIAIAHREGRCSKKIIAENYRVMGCLQSRIVCQHVQIHLVMCQLAVHICATLKVMLIVKQFVGQAVQVQT